MKKHLPVIGLCLIVALLGLYVQYDVNQTVQADSNQYTIVDSALLAHVNITQKVTVFDYNTSSGAGKRLYRISCYVVRQNASSGKPVISYTFGDYVTSNSITSYIPVTSPNLQLENGSESAYSGTNHQECLPVTFYADVGDDIILSYQDSVGHPNDYVFATLEVF